MEIDATKQGKATVFIRLVIAQAILLPGQVLRSPWQELHAAFFAIENPDHCAAQRLVAHRF